MPATVVAAAAGAAAPPLGACGRRRGAPPRRERCRRCRACSVAATIAYWWWRRIPMTRACAAPVCCSRRSQPVRSVGVVWITARRRLRARRHAGRAHALAGQRRHAAPRQRSACARRAPRPLRSAYRALRSIVLGYPDRGVAGADAATTTTGPIARDIPPALRCRYAGAVSPGASLYRRQSGARSDAA